MNPPDNRFKAKIALEVLQGKPADQLAEEHALEAARIEQWAEELKEKAELLFLDQGTEAKSTDKNSGRAPKSIRDYALLLRSTLEATPEGLLVIDLNRNVIAYNHRCIEMWNIPEYIVASGDLDEALRYGIQQLKNPGELQQLVEKEAGNPDMQDELILEFKDGRFLKRYSSPFRLGGSIVGRMTTFVEITEFKETEQKLSRYGDLLDSITTNVNEGILRSTPDEGLVYVNEAFVNMFGYGSKEEVMETPPEQFYADEGRRWELVEKLKEEGQIINEEILLRRKDGTSFWALENSILVKSDGKTYIDAVINDISERKQAEQALRESEEKYRTILKNMEDGYFETNLEGDFTFFNDALARIMGYPKEELLGMNNRDYMDEENARKVYESFNKVYRTGEPEKGFDWELTTRDGTRIYVEASVNLKRDADGEPAGFRGIIRDITERKQKERQIKASLKEKEVLLGEIHHRVKNNLAVISGLLFLQAEKTSHDSAKNLLKQSQSRINSMAIVHEMLYENHTFSNIDPGSYIRQLIGHISGNLSLEGKEIKTEVHTGDLQFDINMAIPCALIINELLTNAYKYAFRDRDSGHIEVSVTQEGDNYRIEVTDDGVGIPEEMKEGSGEGLGLFLVRTLSKQLQGELRVENNGGSRFVITFPKEITV